ncbi:MAG: arginine--tRNA ligase [Deltaproteobacteria bacterium]|nr:arginine--tRNA ligase [Deltaproteobacteria bacterium]
MPGCYLSLFLSEVCEVVVSLRKTIAQSIDRALKKCAGQGFPGVEVPFIEVEATKDKKHGDFATNVAMVLASMTKENPRRIAEHIKNHFDTEGVIERIEIAGPGFINFFVRESVWPSLLEAIDRKGGDYGQTDLGRGKKVQIEFVSANPTGPLHIGHARGAVVGDVLARLLEACGYFVSREYYINDAGNQMNNLGKSVYLRVRELLGEVVDFPETCYKGDYIKELAGEILKREGRSILDKPEEELIGTLTDFAAQAILEGIREDLRVFGVSFDRYFSERELYRDDGVMTLLRELEAEDFIYRDDDTSWFRTTRFGDEKDRVVIRQNGEPTYFAADIAYHKNKFERGFDTLIDIWGADHHGYIPRMQACVQALGYPREALRVVLVQLVNLLREGKPVAMSTRSGQFDTLREVIDEVGKDAARYNFLMRRSDSHLDFDLEIAKQQSNENPVYYVQYAHARICSILRLAEERGYAIPSYQDVDLSAIGIPEEIALVKTLLTFPEVVESAASTLEPHRLTFYLNDLAGQFHSYYNKNKVLTEDRSQSTARLFLVKSIRTIFANALGVLGVSAPERM